MSVPPKFYVPHSQRLAPSMDRLTAWCLDMFVLVCLIGVGQAFFGIKAMSYLLQLLWIYPFICHRTYGATIGKRAMGLRVIGLDGRPLTDRELLRRETIGRMLSVLALGWGYIRILFSTYKQGWHDSMVGSIVVSERKNPTSSLKVIAVSMLMLIVLTVGGVYAALYTSMVGQFYVAKWRKAGIEVEGLSGSPMTGWKVQRLKGETLNLQFELEGLQLKYDMARLLKSDVFEIQEVSVATAQFEFSEGWKSLSKLSPKKEEPTPAEEVASSSTPAASRESPRERWKRMVVSRINIGRVTVRRPGEPDLMMNQFFLSDLGVNRDSFDIKQLYVSSTAGSFQLWDSFYKTAGNLAKINMKVTAQPALHELIRQPIDLSFTWEGSLQAPRKVSLFGLQNRLQVRYDDGVIKVQMHQVSPASYVKLPFPVHAISLRGESSFCRSVACLFGLEMTGRFKLRNQQLLFKNNQAWLEKDPTEVLPFNAAQMLTSLLAPSPVFTVPTDQDEANYLSELYFNKTVADLSDKQRELVTADAVFFKKSAFYRDPSLPPVPMPLQQMNYRVPASKKSN